MARHDYPYSTSHVGFTERHAFIDDLLRPGLRQAFPLIPGTDAHDKPFQVLLDALAERSRAQGPAGREV